MGFGAERFRTMNLGVLTMLEYFQILQSVIETIAIAMMNMLVVFQGSAEVPFHHPAVLAHLLALHSDQMIAEGDRSSAVRRLRLQRSGGISIETPAAIVHVAPAAPFTAFLTAFDHAFRSIHKAIIE